MREWLARAVDEIAEAGDVILFMVILLAILALIFGPLFFM